MSIRDFLAKVSILLIRYQVMEMTGYLSKSTRNERIPEKC